MNKKNLVNPVTIKLGILFVALSFGSTTETLAEEPPFPATGQIAGQWDGVFQCDGYTTSFAVRLQLPAGDTVSGSIERQILGPNLKAHRQPYEKTLAINGQYDAQTGAIAFGTGTGRQQELVIRGIVSPNGDRMTGTAQWALGRGCSPVVMGRNFGGEVKNILSRANTKAYRPKVDPRASCEARVENWVSQPLSYEQYTYQMRNAGDYAALALFEDSRFKPFFGKSFSKMSSRDLIGLENQVARACWAKVDSIGGDAKTANSVLSILRLQRGGTVSAQIYPYAAAIARSWQEQAVASSGTNSPQQLQRLTQIAQLFTQVLWPEGGFNFTVQVANRKSAVGADRMVAALATLLQNDAPGFEQLESVALFEQRFVVGHSSAMESPTRVTRRSRQEVDARRQAQQAARAEQSAEFVVSAEAADAARQDIRTYANEHAVRAAQSYAEQQQTPEQVQVNLLPVGQRTNQNLQTYLTTDTARQVNRIFVAQRDRQAAQFAALEMQAYPSRKAQAANGLAGLATLNAYFRQLQGRYGALLTLSAFDKLRTLTAKDRLSRLQEAQPQLLAQLHASNTVAGMETLLANAVLDEDQQSAAFALVRQAFAARQRELAPFTDYPGAAYLNAIYAGDMRTVETIDNEYQERFKQAMREMGGGGVFNGLYELAIDQIRLVEPATAVYLLNYQKNSARCLRADAASFTVTTTVPTVTTTNLLGVEMARSEGYTINSSFKVNKEFEATFRKVGTMKPNDFLGSMVDQFLGNGGITAVNQGVRKMMRDHACDSDVIERMEDRMRSAFHR